MITKLGLAAAAIGGLLTAQAGVASAHEDCYRQGYVAPAYEAPAYQAPVYQAPVYQAPVVAAPAYNGYYSSGYYAPTYAPVVYGRGPHWWHHHRHPFRRW